VIKVTRYLMKWARCQEQSFWKILFILYLGHRIILFISIRQSSSFSHLICRAKNTNFYRSVLSVAFMSVLSEQYNPIYAGSFGTTGIDIFIQIFASWPYFVNRSG